MPPQANRANHQGFVPTPPPPRFYCCLLEVAQALDFPLCCGIPTDLRKDNADLFAIQGWLAAMILEHNTAGPPPRPPQGYSPQSFLAWLGDNAAQASPAEVEAQLRNALPLLLGDESVLMAFKSGRDMTVLTNRRLLRVDRRGMTGKSVEYLSVPYRCVCVCACVRARVHVRAHVCVCPSVCAAALWTAPSLLRLPATLDFTSRTVPCLHDLLHVFQVLVSGLKRSLHVQCPFVQSHPQGFCVWALDVFA